jgi:Ca2+-binding EF-hand superfamily protein
MKRGLLLAAALLALGPLFLLAADEAKKPDLASDVQDVVFLGDARPVLFRLHLQVNGKPYLALGDDYLRTLFTFLDRDDNNRLNKEEAERAPRAEQILQRAQVAGIAIGPAFQTVRMEELDANKDGTVTFEEFAGYYRSQGVGGLQVRFNGIDGSTDTLFNCLDLNKDGKLTKEELAVAWKSLRKFDLNDDELITLQELDPNAAGANTAALVQLKLAGGVPAAPSGPSPFVVLAGEDAKRRLAQQLLDRYDKNKNRKLSRTEIGLDRDTFQLLDADEDGELDLTELAHFGQVPATLAVVVRLGTTGAKELPIEVVAAEKLSGEMARAVGEPANGALTLTLGNARIDLRGNAVGPNPRAPVPVQVSPIRRFVMQQFQQADAGKKGFLTKQEVEGQQILNTLVPFALADRDVDGKLTEQEVNAFLELDDRAAVCLCSLTVSENSQVLFNMLNGNSNGRLSQRELRNAWNRVASLDSEGTGVLERSMIPRQYALQLSQGAVNGGVRAGPAVVARPLGDRVPQQPGAAGGPLWFRKMDRNGDGDVSRREWLGSKEDFEKIDSDGDGLISLEEAQKADEWYRKNVQKD